MSGTKKPRICEVLGVEVGETFKFGNLFCRVNKDGWMYKNPLNSGWVLAEGPNVCAAINHPESIKRKPRWTAEDIEDAKAIRRIWPEAVSVTRKDDDEISVRIRKTFHPGSGLLLYGEGNIFGSLQPGETVTLDEILEAEHGE